MRFTHRDFKKSSLRICYSLSKESYYALLITLVPLLFALINNIIFIIPLITWICIWYIIALIKFTLQYKKGNKLVNSIFNALVQRSVVK